MTDRDLNFLYFLLKYKVGITKQIRENSYPTSPIKGLRKRIKKLEKVKLVKFSSIFINNHFHKAYHLTEKGLRVLIKMKGLELRQVQLKSNSVVHDLHLVYILESLKQSRNVIDLISENELHCIDGHINSERHGEFVKLYSDGYALIKLDNVKYNVAIEYENSRKAATKYEQLVIDYHLGPSVDVVIYFTKDESIRKCIIEFEKKHYPNSEPKFYFHTMENDFGMIKKLSFANRKGQTVEL